MWDIIALELGMGDIKGIIITGVAPQKKRHLQRFSDPLFFAAKISNKHLNMIKQ
jgi:hypothetical protein